MEKIIDFIRQIVEEEFEKEFIRLEKTGLLKYELHNIFFYCTSIFEEHKELGEEDKELRWLITGGISEYFENEVKESVSWDIIRSKN
jgi:hypothetical protein